MNKDTDFVLDITIVATSKNQGDRISRHRFGSEILDDKTLHQIFESVAMLRATKRITKEKSALEIPVSKTIVATQKNKGGQNKGGGQNKTA